MATVKKSVKKAQVGGQCKWSGKRGGGVSSSSRGSAKSNEYKPGRIPRMSRKEQEESDKQARVFEALKRSGKSDKPASTAPGIRSGNKKGPESFFGGDKDINEAKYGKKVNSSVKKAKIGMKVKSIKKSIKKK